MRILLSITFFPQIAPFMR